MPASAIVYDALSHDLPQPCAFSLRAGPVTLRFVDGDLRDLYAGGEELVRRITFNVRHHRWDTAAMTIDRLRLMQTADTFQLRYMGRCAVDDALYAWTADLNGAADGTVIYRVSGAAHVAMSEVRRAGLNVLFHADVVSGLDFDLTNQAGATTSLAFPMAVGSNHLLATEFQKISFRTRGGAHVVTEVTGSHFGLEDQRVAGDNSFKAFSGLRHHYAPLAAKDLQEESIKITCSHLATLTHPLVPEVQVGSILPNSCIPTIDRARPQEGYGVFHELTRRPAAKNGIFLDVNSAPEKSHGAEALTWGWYPNINLSDDETLMENTGAIVGQVGAVRRFAPAASIRIDPISLDSIHPRPVPRDPRNDSLFGAAWTAAAIKYLALSAVDEAAFAVDGAPARAVQRELGAHAGRPLRAVQVHTRGAAPLDALALEAEDGLAILAANLTGATAPFVLTGLPSSRAVRIRRLNEPAGTAFREVPGTFSDGTGRIHLTLSPHEVISLSFNT